MSDKKHTKNTNELPEKESIQNLLQEEATDKELSEEELAAQEESLKHQRMLSGENMLELKNLSKKERKAIKRQKYKETTADMSFFQKIGYFWTYYKAYILVPIFILACLSYITITVYKNTRPKAIGYAILNVGDGKKICTDFEKDYVDFHNIKGEYRIIASTKYNVDYDFFLEHSESIRSGTSTDYNLLKNNCEVGDYDVIITNLTGLKYCANVNCIVPIAGYFDKNQYEAIEPYIYELKLSNEAIQPFALDISNTEFAKGLNLPYDDVYLAFPGAYKINKKNAIRMIHYIYGIDLSEFE